MIEYLSLLLAIPLGITLAEITKKEKEIYSKKIYFPAMLFILAIATIISSMINKTMALTLTFVFLTTLVWHKA